MIRSILDVFIINAICYFNYGKLILEEGNKKKLVAVDEDPCGYGIYSPVLRGCHSREELMESENIEDTRLSDNKFENLLDGLVCCRIRVKRS